MRRGVADEFASEIAILDSIVAVNEGGSEDDLRLLDATDPAGPPLSEEEIRAWGEREPGGVAYESSFGTLATLTSSGGLEQISGLELRRSLAGWPAHVEDAEWGRNQIYDAVDRLIERQAELGLASAALGPRGPWEARVPRGGGFVTPEERESPEILAATIPEFLSGITP